MQLTAANVTDPHNLKTARAIARRLAAAIGPGAKVEVERYGPGSYGLSYRWGASVATAIASALTAGAGALRIVVIVGSGPAHADLRAAVRRAGLGRERGARPAATTFGIAPEPPEGAA